MPNDPLRRTTALICCLLAVFTVPVSAQTAEPSPTAQSPAGSVVPAPAPSVVDRLRGSWSGTGRADFDGGTTENMRCTAYYRTPSPTELMLAIRCARQDSKVELRGALKIDGTKLTGTWQERAFNAEGAFTGSAGADEADLEFSGVASGKLALRMQGGKQVIVLSSSGTGLKGFTITLDRN